MKVNEKIVELEEGETIKVIGQNSTILILTNVEGSIYSRTDYKRENGF